MPGEICFVVDDDRIQHSASIDESSQKLLHSIAHDADPIVHPWADDF